MNLQAHWLVIWLPTELYACSSSPSRVVGAKEAESGPADTPGRRLKAVAVAQDPPPATHFTRHFTCSGKGADGPSACMDEGCTWLQLFGFSWEVSFSQTRLETSAGGGLEGGLSHHNHSKHPYSPGISRQKKKSVAASQFSWQSLLVAARTTTGGRSQ